jgi:predicted O-methyltransferase YrrM
MASNPTGTNVNTNCIESIEELQNTLLHKKSGVITIKPRVVFQLIEKNYSVSPIIKIPTPSSMIGSVTTLEASLICSLLFLTKPKKIFEFGTFFGYTTLIMLSNTNQSTKVYTIDLPSDNQKIENSKDQPNWELIRTDDRYNDNYLTNLVHERGEKYLQESKLDSRLYLIKEDSTNFKPDAFDLLATTDFIFLDGGHTDPVVRADTHNSLKMLSENGILIWHDYNSTIHRKVTQVVNEHAQKKVVIHIQNTMLAITTLHEFDFVFSETN